MLLRVFFAFVVPAFTPNMCIFAQHGAQIANAKIRARVADCFARGERMIVILGAFG